MLEVLKQALEALELWLNRKLDEDTAWQAHTSLRQAIAELESQEPVAWMNKHGACTTSLLKEVEAGAKEEYTIPVYTHPPQRTWVGLTDEEENEYNYLGPDMHWVIQEIAAKLKEKNHG